MSKPREYYWVPENSICDCASDALDENKYPDGGAAALVANHVVYDDLKKAYQALEQQNKAYLEALEKINNTLVHGETDIITAIGFIAREVLEKFK